jgi:LacI family transcriptional regulator
VSTTRARRPATIYDVASHAGVSHQTVTRYLAGFQGIRPETRAKVEAAVQELNYRPNHLARTLRTGRPNRIVVLAHELGHLGPGRVVQGAIAECRERGYTVEIVDFDGSDERCLHESLDFIGQQPLAGVLATAQTDGVRRALEHWTAGVPGLMDSPAKSIQAVSTGADGGRIAGEHLAALGHREVSYLAGPMDWSVARDRLTGLEEALEACGGRVLRVLEGDWSPRSGYEIGMAGEPNTWGTALFAANDHMAIGFLRAMHDRGVAVPQHLSVMGFDDIPEARYLLPALSTVSDDFEREGRHAAACLIADIENKPQPQKAPNLLTLVARQSTAAPASTEA